MDIAAWVGLTGGVLGLVGLLSAALVVARSNIAKGTIQLLEDNQAALKSRLETVEAENTLLTARIKALEQTNDQLFQQVKSLPAFQAIASSLVDVHETLEVLVKGVTDLKEEIHDGR